MAVATFCAFCVQTEAVVGWLDRVDVGHLGVVVRAPPVHLLPQIDLPLMFTIDAAIVSHISWLKIVILSSPYVVALTHELIYFHLVVLPYELFLQAHDAALAADVQWWHRGIIFACIWIPVEVTANAHRIWFLWHPSNINALVLVGKGLAASWHLIIAGTTGIVGRVLTSWQLSAVLLIAPLVLLGDDADLVDVPDLGLSVVVKVFLGLHDWVWSSSLVLCSQLVGEGLLNSNIKLLFFHYRLVFHKAKVNLQMTNRVIALRPLNLVISFGHGQAHLVLPLILQ